MPHRSARGRKIIGGNHGFQHHHRPARTARRLARRRLRGHPGPRPIPPFRWRPRSAQPGHPLRDHRLDLRVLDRRRRRPGAEDVDRHAADVAGLPRLWPGGLRALFLPDRPLSRTAPGAEGAAGRNRDDPGQPWRPAAQPAQLNRLRGGVSLARRRGPRTACRRDGSLRARLPAAARRRPLEEQYGRTARGRPHRRPAQGPGRHLQRSAGAPWPTG